MGMGPQLTRCMRLLGALLASGLVTASLATAVDVGEQAPDFTLKTFADSLQLPHPLLSDHPDLKVIREKWLPEVQSALFPSDPIIEKVRELTGKL
jgi:hypothetical protein